MDFFEHQAQARQRTRELVALYGLAVCAIMAAVYGLLIFLLNYEVAPPDREFWIPELFLVVFLFLGGLIAMGSAYKILTLKGGGKAVAEMLGGQKLQPGTTDPHEQRLMNIVEEMAIASGTPIPPVYVMQEDGINAFAAGFTPADAVIGVTRGCLKTLNRDELQGVVAHEFSHILYGDMRLNIRLIGILFGILLINLLGQTLLRITFYSGGTRRRSRNSKDSGGMAMVMVGLSIGLIIVGAIGVFFGRLIKSAVSRQREFLADASAVQFTRNPAGIAGALKKIAGTADGSRLQTIHAEEASHMFFANGLRPALLGLMATHPPLQERIRRIEAGGPPAQPADARPPPASPGAPARPPRISPDAVTLAIGALDQQHMVRAGALLASIPDPVRTALHDIEGARSAVYGLLLSKQRVPRERQWDCLREREREPVLRQSARIEKMIAELPAQARMPLLDLALPALQNMTAADYAAFRETLRLLIDADENISIFEYALTRLLDRHLAPAFEKSPPPAVRYRRLKPLLPSVIPLLALLARFGNEDDDEQAHRDYQAGLGKLDITPPPPMPSDDGDPVQVFDKALALLQHADLPLKKSILSACATAVASNNSLTPEEGELLRAVAYALDCPIPPFLG